MTCLYQKAIVRFTLNQYTWSETRDLASVGMLVLKHGNVLRQLIEEHGGKVVKTIGDAFLVVFDDPDKSVACACAIVRQVASDNKDVSLSSVKGIKVALHHGRVLMYEQDVYGDVVNTVSRLEKCAGPGDIVLSSHVLDVLKEKPAVEDLGVKKLKGKTVKIPVFRLKRADVSHSGGMLLVI